jgi:hypothetical protein
MVKDLVELPVSSVSDSNMGGLGCFEVVLTGRFNICRAIGFSIHVFCAGISTLTAGWEGYPATLLPIILRTFLDGYSVCCSYCLAVLDTLGWNSPRAHLLYLQ